MSVVAVYSQEVERFDQYPIPGDINLWPVYQPDGTTFRIWSPAAEAVRLHLYAEGEGGAPMGTYDLLESDAGVWTLYIDGDLKNQYYAFQVRYEGNWLRETPGIYAQATGVNGMRAMVVDLPATNPEGWNTDKGPELKQKTDAVIYELHLRDMTMSHTSGSSWPGKYLGLSEKHTNSGDGLATGIDHLTELGITHVHILPCFDFASIDESRLDQNIFNWGYDPQNYNVPEGSYSTDPAQGDIRIREFKEMVKALHDAHIGVIMDVVYNHTSNREGSNFNLENPGYYYRQREDGSWSDASACGNETASEREMMRRFIIASLSYWTKEYHIDGFRFDLMGIHDLETMNAIHDALKAINPDVLLYGEGWTAGDSPLAYEDRALKAHVSHMPGISVFSDDIRDGLKGWVFDAADSGFVSGKMGMEGAIRFGVVGAIAHPQVNYIPKDAQAPWAADPTQTITYVSCHDNHTLYDRLLNSRPDATEAEHIAMQKLALAIVLTSQGISFLHSGSELLRTKHGEENSYNKPDSINALDWHRKRTYADVFAYCKNLIALRKAHPAFRMTDAADVRTRLNFNSTSEHVISYTLNGIGLEGERWQQVRVIYNALPEPYSEILDGSWHLAILGDSFTLQKSSKVTNTIEVPGISMAILFR